MPYAMCFDWRPNGHATGLAIHGTSDENVPALGSPASPGCVRLSREHAQELFTLIQSRFRSPAPQLAYLNAREGMSSEGLLLHDQTGNLKMRDGYSVLVSIDDFAQDDIVASIR